eukprot:5370779-Amphidinium_carterae.1
MFVVYNHALLQPMVAIFTNLKGSRPMLQKRTSLLRCSTAGKLIGVALSVCMSSSCKFKNERLRLRDRPEYGLAAAFWCTLMEHEHR